MLTTRHFDHVHAFLHARLEPLLEPVRALDSEPLVTALTAVLNTVDDAHGSGTHVLATGGWDPDNRDTIVEAYWDHLTGLARGWQTHSSYERDFDPTVEELGGVQPLVQP